MKRLLPGLLTLTVILLGASMKDDDEVTLSNYCYISNVTLGSFKRALTTTASDGSDSTYYTSISGSYFPMTIDQRKLVIENRDSLPYGADVSAILLTISFDGSIVSYRPADTDSASWTAYTSSDSIDLSKPVHLSVTSDDLSSYRIYTLKVNIHQQEGDSLYWTRTDSVPEIFQHMAGMRALWLNGKLHVLGQTADGWRLATKETSGWSLQASHLSAETSLETLRQARGKVYVSDSKGQLFTSSDAVEWETLGVAREGMILAAVTDDAYYALCGSSLLRSEDAVQWTAEQLDEDTSMLPSRDVLSIAYREDNGRQRLLVAGQGNQTWGRNAWVKTWKTASEETTAMWMYMTPSADNKYPCPVLQHQTLLRYDDRLFTFGGRRIDGAGDAMDCLYVSNDNGITWKRDLYIHLPSLLEGVEGPVTAVTDDDYHIWIIADNQVWRGRLNRLAFDRQ